MSTSQLSGRCGRFSVTGATPDSTPFQAFAFPRGASRREIAFEGLVFLSLLALFLGGSLAALAR